MSKQQPAPKQSVVITDENYVQHLDSGDGLCGCLPRRSAYGSLPFAAADTSFQPIPWDEFPDRIADQERNKSSLEHIWKDSGAWVLNQNPLNYCWAFSGVAALMLMRAQQGLPFVRLSPSSVAAPIVNFRNQGYYPEACLKGMVDQGAASVEFVPETTTNPRDFKPGWREDAAKNKVIMWADVAPRNLQVHGSYLLLNRPSAVGLNWWAHSILYVRLIDKYPSLPANNWRRYATRALQSYGPGYGDGGLFDLEGERQLADQIYAIQQASLS